jgi:quinol monooxygenase YgiN
MAGCRDFPSQGQGSKKQSEDKYERRECASKGAGMWVEKKMVIATIENRIHPSKREHFLELLDSVKKHPRGMRGCLECSILEEICGDNRTMLYLERWQSREAMYRHLRSSIDLRVLHCIDLADRPPEIAFYEVSGAVSLSPPRYPPFNGKKERSIRDIKSYEQAQRRHRQGTVLAERLAETFQALNEQRPRPVLGGRTAREVFEGNCGKLPDRRTFRKEVSELEQKLIEQACSRTERNAARRKTVEEVFLRYGLFKEMADVAIKSNAETVTN